MIFDPQISKLLQFDYSLNFYFYFLTWNVGILGEKKKKKVRIVELQQFESLGDKVTF
jgi:hypothetical protein